MYEEEKFGWRSYKYRLIFIGFVWLLAIVFRDSWGPPAIGGTILAAIFLSLVCWVLGAEENELRYQNSSQIFCENGLHFSYHPHAVHTKGKYTIIAAGGFSTGGIEWKSGEGTLVFPTVLLQAAATNPTKVLHLRAAPIQCSNDALPQGVRDYIAHAGFGYFKSPYYFTITPIVAEGEDQEFRDAIIKLSSTEGELKDLNKQVTERDRIIRQLLALREEIKDFHRPWYKKFLSSGGPKQEEE